MEKRLDEYLLKDEKVLWHGRAKENDFLSTKLLNVLPVMLLWLIAECVVLGVAIINKISFKNSKTTIFIMQFFSH